MWNGDMMPDSYHKNLSATDIASVTGTAMATNIDNAITNAIFQDASASSSRVQELEKRVENLEMLLDKLLTEFMPEYKI